MNLQNTILVTGANGQLGNEFRFLEKKYPSFNFLFVSKSQLNLNAFDEVNKYFEFQKINYCINCAAYTAVDKAETDIEAAYLVNANAVENLATICKNNNTQLIHISTDYVFDGSNIHPYSENDNTCPVSIYGKSKLKGEELAIQKNPSTIIIRTSWVYSTFGHNFVKTMLRLMKERESIGVVNDQLGSPTYAKDLANAIMKIIIAKKTITKNIYNYCNQGIISWYDFAIAIKNIIKSNCIINPVTTIQFPTPAKRPKYSVLDTTLINQTFSVDIFNWEESLKKCLQLDSSI